METIVGGSEDWRRAKNDCEVESEPAVLCDSAVGVSGAAPHSLSLSLSDVSSASSAWASAGVSVDIVSLPSSFCAWVTTSPKSLRAVANAVSLY